MPISAPRFSKQKTCSTPGSEDSSAVRSAHASTTSSACSSLSELNDALWSEVKQTTSQRPIPGRTSLSPPTCSYEPVLKLNDGKRFSNTATSYGEGISEPG